MSEPNQSDPASAMSPIRLRTNCSSGRCQPPKSAASNRDGRCILKCDAQDSHAMPEPLELLHSNPVRYRVLSPIGCPNMVRLGRFVARCHQRRARRHLPVQSSSRARPCELLKRRDAGSLHAVVQVLVGRRRLPRRRLRRTCRIPEISADAF